MIDSLTNDEIELAAHDLGQRLSRAIQEERARELALQEFKGCRCAACMLYDEYRCQELPTTSAWMESAVKEMNFQIKGTEMFWNNPEGAEAIPQIRAASLSDDDRLSRFLSHRPGVATVRRNASFSPQAA